MSEIVISGYHGFSNSGDEALLWAILTTLRKLRPEITVTVLSKTPEKTAETYGVKSVNRYHFGKIRKEMKEAKLLLFGGGSLLQDVTSGKSIWYYLSVIRMAQKCGIKTMLYANGIGPIIKPGNRRFAARVLNRVDMITLRDDHSDEELKRLGVTKPDIVITADPAFTIDTSTALSGRYFMHLAGVGENEKVAVVAIRPWKKSAEDFSAILADACDTMVERYGIYPLFVPMQYPADMASSRAVMAKMKQRAYFLNRELTVPEVFSVLSCAELVIGMRLHSLIYATTLEIPAMALVYDPKVSAFMTSLNQPDCVNVEEMTAEAVSQTLERLIREKDERRSRLHETNAILKKKAEENAGYAIALLDEER